MLSCIKGTACASQNFSTGHSVICDAAYLLEDQDQVGLTRQAAQLLCTVRVLSRAKCRSRLTVLTRMVQRLCYYSSKLAVVLQACIALWHVWRPAS